MKSVDGFCLSFPSFFSSARRPRVKEDKVFSCFLFNDLHSLHRCIPDFHPAIRSFFLLFLPFFCVHSFNPSFIIFFLTAVLFSKLSFLPNSTSSFHLFIKESFCFLPSFFPVFPFSSTPLFLTFYVLSSTFPSCQPAFLLSPQLPSTLSSYLFLLYSISMLSHLFPQL